ncbi:MAG: hypothetical protein LIO96_02210, partial [Lachnospiraceae bacterium]|nr:hypothetical protein [Lachnospiraceae bacterium]
PTMKNYGGALPADARDPVYRLMESFSARENFGNGRFVDQVVDFTINKRSLRPYCYRGNDILPEDVPEIHEMRRIAVGMRDTVREENVSGPDRMRVAIHEAGHALVSRVLWPERELKVVSIREDAVSAGKTGLGLVTDKMLTEKNLKAELAICFGGRNAEHLCLGDSGIGSSGDYNRAREIAGLMVKE